MNHDENPSRSKPNAERRDTVNVAVFLCRAINAPLQAGARRPGTCGNNYFSIPALAALLAVPTLYAVALSSPQNPARGHPRNDERWLLVLMCLYIGLLVIHRIAFALRGSEERAQIHSQSGGQSWFNSSGTVRGERLARLIGEPAACAFIGLIFREGRICYPLGCYFLIGAVTLLVEMLTLEQIDRVRRQALRDARIEAEYNASIYRDSERR